MEYLNIVNGAERIGVPNGENNEAYRRTFEAVTGIEIPFTKGRRLDAKSQGRQFFLFKGMDIPARVDDGLIDIGITGTDTILETALWGKIRSQNIGDMICRFSILANPATKDEINRLLTNRPRFSLFELPTSRPRMLNGVASFYDLPFVAMDIEINGCVEAYAEATGVGAVADLVQTGETARANDLEEVYALKEIGTAIVWRRQDESL